MFDLSVDLLEVDSRPSPDFDLKVHSLMDLWCWERSLTGWLPWTYSIWKLNHQFRIVVVLSMLLYVLAPSPSSCKFFLASLLAYYFAD